MDHADVRYLETKRTVDDRARSRRVRDRLLAAIPESPGVVDAGAGTGVMLERLLAWGVRPESYRGIDRSGALVEHARTTLPGELAERYPVDEREATERRDDRSGASADGFRVEGIDVRFETGDVLGLSEGSADLVVAQALLDLVPIEDAMDAIVGALRPGGLAYLPITFDGVSLFLPEHPDDRVVVEAYHGAIDDEPGRDSRAGRRLLDHLGTRPGALLAVDASDWIVRPRGDGYPADEAAFLDYVLGFVRDAVEGRGVDAEGWLSERRRQHESARLSYVAHGYDFLYRTPGP